MAISSMLGLHTRLLRWICPMLHQWEFTRTASPPPLRLPLEMMSLSARMVWKPGRVTAESSVSSCSQVSVKHMILHSLYCLCVLVSASSSSILLASDRTLPVMTAGTQGLNLRHFRRLLTGSPFFFSSATPVVCRTLLRAGLHSLVRSADHASTQCQEWHRHCCAW